AQGHSRDVRPRHSQFARAALRDCWLCAYQNVGRRFSRHGGRSGKDHLRTRPHRPAKVERFRKKYVLSPGRLPNPESYASLVKRRKELSGHKELCSNRLFYRSTPPDGYPEIIEQLGRA